MCWCRKDQASVTHPRRCVGCRQRLVPIALVHDPRRAYNTSRTLALCCSDAFKNFRVWRAKYVADAKQMRKKETPAPVWLWRPGEWRLTTRCVNEIYVRQTNKTNTRSFVFINLEEYGAAQSAYTSPCSCWKQKHLPETMDFFSPMVSFIECCVPLSSITIARSHQSHGQMMSIFSLNERQQFSIN